MFSLHYIERYDMFSSNKSDIKLVNIYKGIKNRLIYERNYSEQLSSYYQIL